MQPYFHDFLVPFLINPGDFFWSNRMCPAPVWIGKMYCKKRFGPTHGRNGRRLPSRCLPSGLRSGRVAAIPTSGGIAAGVWHATLSYLNHKKGCRLHQSTGNVYKPEERCPCYGAIVSILDACGISGVFMKVLIRNSTTIISRFAPHSQSAPPAKPAALWVTILWAAVYRL